MRAEWRIVRRASDGGRPGYAGMDRPRLAEHDDVPKDLLREGLALEDAPPGDIEARSVRFLETLRTRGIRAYELIRRGGNEHGPGTSLGYDVGETTEAAWSAIRRHAAFLDLDEWQAWMPRLNAHGLFGDRADAEAFLLRYLESDDPDKGWTDEGWTEQPDIYEVIPIRRVWPPTTNGSR